MKLYGRGDISSHIPSQDTIPNANEMANSEFSEGSFVGSVRCQAFDEGERIGWTEWYDCQMSMNKQQARNENSDELKIRIV